MILNAGLKLGLVRTFLAEHSSDWEHKADSSQKPNSSATTSEVTWKALVWPESSGLPDSSSEDREIFIAIWVLCHLCFNLNETGLADSEAALVTDGKLLF